MIYKILFFAFLVYAVVYTASFAVYEYRNGNTLSVFGNAVLIAAGTVLYVFAFVI